MASDLASARHYAQAALELAVEENALDRWQQDLEVVGRLWTEGKGRGYLSDGRLSTTVLIERARQMLGPHIGPQALNMILLMISRGRAALLPLVVGQFTTLRERRELRAQAEVTSAIPLTDEQRAEIERRLSAESGQQVTVTNKVDVAILGGLVIRQGDQLLDASIATKLRRLQAQIATNEEKRLI